jgi:hypothetical protein
MHSRFLLDIFTDLYVEEQELQQKKHGTAFAAGAAKWAEGASCSINDNLSIHHSNEGHRI